jgi:Xaa-Pro aminopeptidase
VIADPGMTASFVAERLMAAGARVKRAADPCQLPKACKNAAEVEGARKAHIRDGAALTRFLAWFEREAPKGQLDEIKAAEALEGFRSEVNELVDLSFDSISGAGPHAALPHYRVTRSTNRAIRNN